MGTEFRRAFGWPFVVAMLAMTAVFMSSSFEELLCTAANPGLSYYYLFAMAEMLSPHVYVAPFLCALPYAASFADELNHHFLPLMLQRQGIRRYLNRRMLAAFVSGFGVYFGGLLLAGVIHIIFGNPIPQGELRELWFESWVPRDDLWEYIFAGDHGVRTILVECAYYGMQGGLMALLGLMISAYWPNRYVALAFPFILYLILFTVSSVIPYPFYQVTNKILTFPANRSYPARGPIWGWVWTAGNAIAWYSLAIGLFCYKVRKRLNKGDL